MFGELARRFPSHCRAFSPSPTKAEINRRNYHQARNKNAGVAGVVRNPREGFDERQLASGESAACAGIEWKFDREKEKERRLPKNLRSLTVIESESVCSLWLRQKTWLKTHPAENS